MPHVFNILAQDPLTFWMVVEWLAWTAAVSVGMAYLGQALFGQDLKEAELPEDAQSRIWNPHTTQREGLPRPRCYGRNIHHCNIIGKWTDVDGDEREILYLLLEHGDGPTKGNVADMLWLNDQPAGNFGSVEVQERVGTMDQTCMTGFEKPKLEYRPDTELVYEEPYYWTTPNKFFDDIEYTIALPNGLLKHYKDGGWTTGYISLRVRIRVHEPVGEWQTLYDGVISKKTMKPLFKKYLVSEQKPGYLERGKQYDLEFENLSPEKEKLIRNMFARSIREVVDVAFTHPGKALTGIKAIATAKLSGNLDVKVIREDRLVNVYDGENWNIEYSRNRSWITFDLITQPVISGNVGTWAIEKYEGTDPSNLDLDFFLDWADFCSTQVLDGYGDTEDRLACDIKVETATNVWDMVHDIAEIGRAKIWWAGNKLTGWIDKEITEPTDLVTMNSIMARTWKNHWVTADELAGTVEILYDDKRQGYEHVPYVHSNPDAGKYTRTIAIEGIGVTTYGTAVHVANHALTRNQLIRNVNNFRQFKDAFLHKLGEVIRVQHRIPNWGQGYRVINCPTASTMKLDRLIEGVNIDDLLFVKSYDEANKKVDTSVYTIASVAGAVVTIDETWSPTPVKNNSVAIGIDGAIVTRRITKMEPTVDNYFDVTVETYDAALYDADDLDPDAPNKDYIWNAPPGTLAKPVSHDDVVELFDTLIPPQPDIEIPWLSNCEFTGDEIDTVTWAARDADEEIVFRLRGVDYEINPEINNNTTDEFIYWDPAFTDRFRTTNLISVATSAGNWYMCRNVAGVAYPVNSMMLAHIGVLLAGFLKVGTADIEDLSVSTVKIANQAVTFMVAAFTEQTLYYADTNWHLAQTVTITTTGAPVMLIASVQWENDGDNGMDIRVQRDNSVDVYIVHNYSIAQLGNPFCASVVDEPDADEHTYDLDIKTTNVDIGDPHIWFRLRSLVIKEVKK